jgi:uncharacterized protein (TIGR01777 family)
MTRFVKRSPMPVAAETLAAWHERPGAFERLTPPWDDVRVVERHGGIRDGDRAVIELRKGPVRRRWTAVHRDFVEGRQFVDDQVSGPFAAWTHTHRFVPDGPSASVLEDVIDYRLPGGVAGHAFAGGFTERTLERTFAYRHRRTAGDLIRHDRAGGKLMRVAITGATGEIGSALSAFLTTGGHRVDRIVRREPAPGTTEIRWEPAAGQIDASALEGVDAVVHLAGENIGGRWTDARKRDIMGSRRTGTRVLAEALAGLERKPEVIVSASAIGYYGDRGDEVLTEDSSPGDDFLAEVCKEWEAATGPALEAGIRVVRMRTGVVLESVLPRMAVPFKLGAGGRIGSGRQWWSWVALDDVVGAYHHALTTQELAGAVNVVSPSPVTNADFARALGRVLKRPTFLPLPSAAVKTMLGELGESLLLASQRVSPGRLQAAGFDFHEPELQTALRHALGK